MIARQVCLFPLNNLSPAAACIQSWMLLFGNNSGTHRTCIAGQFVKGAQRG
jgi:hypothetical protein